MNDVWAATRDPDTAVAAAEADAHLVLMHNQEAPGYPAGVFETVVAGFGRRSRRPSRGVARERIIVDPGIGFGKGTGENLELLHRLAELKPSAGSRCSSARVASGSWASSSTGLPSDDRVEATAATVALAIAAGATSSGSTMSRTSPARAGSPMPSCADDDHPTD